jgi:hypothetical protein
LPPAEAETACTLSGAEADPVWRDLAALPQRPDARLSFKANLLPSQVGAFCQTAVAIDPAPMIQAHAGSGIVTGHLSDGLTRGQATTYVERLQARAEELGGGSLVVCRCPAEWKSGLLVWGRPRGDRDLMRTVKARLDPAGLFNPGRFIDARLPDAK